MNTITEYVLNKKKQRIGVVLATKDRDRVVVGWSKTRKKDVFDKNLGYQIAEDRALKDSIVAVPSDIVPAYNRIIDRAKRYFRTDSVFVTEKRPAIHKKDSRICVE